MTCSSCRWARRWLPSLKWSLAISKSGDASRKSGALKDLDKVFVPKEAALRLVDYIPDDIGKKICSGKARPGSAVWFIRQEICRPSGRTATS